MPEVEVVPAAAAAVKTEKIPTRKIYCAYCGLTEQRFLAYCGAENCQKWFCNGTRDGLNKSHIVAHCGKSKHTSVMVFRGIPAGTSKRKSQSVDFIVKNCTYQPKCAKCNSNNIFDLGTEDTADPYNPARTWCRKHAVVEGKVGKNQWNTLVAAHKEDEKAQQPEEVFFIRLPYWLMPVVPKASMKDNREWSLKMWGLEKLEREVDILEEFWRWKPEGTKDEFLDWKTAVDNFVVTRRVDFSDRQEYAAYWDSLVMELSRQEKGTVESLPPMRNLEIKWMSAYDIEVKVPQGIFTEFLEIGRPMEVSWMILKDGEEYSMWQRDATISALRQLDTGHVVVVHCLSAVNPSHHRVSRELRFRMVYNDVNYWRMNQALYKLEHDPSCVSQQVLDMLLGRVVMTQELLHEWRSNFASTALEAAEWESDGEEDEKTVAEALPRTMNGSLGKFVPPPFHTEYVDAGNEFRSYNFDQMILPRLNRRLNERQRLAVDMALKAPVCLIQGPPGTGKTETAAAIVVNFTKDPMGKILVCAPSNVAIDHLTLKIAKISKDMNILRLFAHTRDVECLAEGVRKYTVFSKFKKERPREAITEAALRVYEKECVRKAKIVCCTCNSAGLMSLDRVAFPYVLIDEAAQGMEPECLIAITRACEKLVLIGDPAQLGAVVRFPNLQKSQLTTSLFQRLWKVCPWMILTQQYRMHPAISKMISQITYEDQLVNDQCVLARTSASILLNDIFGMIVPLPDLVRYHELLFAPDGMIYAREGIIPMLFVSLARNDELSGSGTSFVNMAEAHFIARLVANILHEGHVFSIPGLEKPHPEEIGIITFYNGQRPQLEIELKCHPRINQRFKDIEINSVDGFQGREKDIIILSCVRSADSYRGRRTLGFTDDPQRLNVAMSRARKALIVVGSWHIFYHSDMWRRYFRYIPVIQAETVCHLLPLPCSTKPPCKICPDDQGLRIQQAMVNMGH
ncbi:uncharacterized protein LOC129592583 [Paramacrobiotus metropolitanus]|uniref:uncharacterized protein LOC129592583 n=1 Tax=Paramacrobiotus metropolitanus TaxID=2943436 RepID=UPI002446289C|nr:uncharacterized protein LOC129592583 [Paramacrobiotus metropolitanus]